MKDARIPGYFDTKYMTVLPVEHILCNFEDQKNCLFFNPERVNFLHETRHMGSDNENEILNVMLDKSTYLKISLMARVPLQNIQWNFLFWPQC